MAIKRRRVERNSLIADAGLLAGGTAFAAVLAYAVLLAITRGLGEADAAPVVLIWNFWLLATAALGSPVQQWIVRSSVVGVPRPRQRSVLIRLTYVVLGLTLVLVVSARWADQQLFRSSSWAYPAAIGLVTVGAWGLGVFRGRLAAAGRYAALAVSSPAENSVRLVVVALLLAVGADAEVLAFVIPAGYAILLSAPLFPSDQRWATSEDAEEGSFGSLTLISVTTQLLFASVPIVVSLAGGTAAAVTGAFAIVAVVRIPNLLTNAMSVRVLESMTQVAIEQPSEARGIRRRIAVAVLAAASIGTLLMAGIGRHAVASIFGLNEAFPLVPSMLVTTGALVAVGVLLLSFSAVAEGATRPIIASGLAALVLGAGIATLPYEPELRASLAFGLAECLFFAGLVLAPSLNRSLADSQRR